MPETLPSGGKLKVPVFEGLKQPSHHNPTSEVVMLFSAIPSISHVNYLQDISNRDLSTA